MDTETDSSPLRLPEAGNLLLDPLWTPGPEEIAPYLDGMILSASGWRAVFAADGDEESSNPEAGPEHLLLVGLAARVFAGAIRGTLAEKTSISTPGAKLRVAVGADTRPTGPLLAQAAIRAFLGERIEPEYLFVAASPEIMALTRTREDISGFLYVSASHNPIGHNGLKMGLGDGSVAGGEFSTTLVAQFRALAADPSELQKTADMLRVSGSAAELEIYRMAPAQKRAAADIYRAFTEEVIRGPGPRAEEAIAELTVELQAIRPGIVADMNGSARTVSIDQSILADVGCRLQSINNTAGLIRHQIVPEGAGLAECVTTLSASSHADPGFIMGYVPDNDGDRGNLVVSEAPGSARPLEAQEVFALAAVAELSWLYYTGTAGPDSVRTDQKLAIVVNGPTSMRIERIAELLGTEVHRAEVGEANVVGRARELRDDGYIVRFLGEGSNGGNITHPSAVRDPIQTVFAVLKLLYAPARAGTPAPGRFWLRRRTEHHAGQTGSDAGATTEATAPVTLKLILDSLPQFTTTSAYDPMAIMKVACSDHGALKTEVERLWEAEWPRLENIRTGLGVTRYRYENYEGTVCRPGRGNRTGRGRGGFKILLTDDHDQPRAFLWMRGSGTEPVFRVMVDVEGDSSETERTLLHILRGMVTRADERVAAST